MPPAADPPLRLRPLWEDTAPPAPDAPPLAGEVRADVAVVGGGLTGLSAALSLAEAGARTVLLEAGPLGAGASGRSGGQVIPGLKRDPWEIEAELGRERAEPLLAFAGATADALFALIDRHGIDAGAARAGWIQCAHDRAALRLVHRRAAAWAARGAPVAALSAEEVAALTGTAAYCGGWIDRRAGRLNPLALLRGLARAAIAAGAALHAGTAVRRIAPAAPGWRLATATGSVTAEAVLLCPGAHAGTLWPGLGESVVAVETAQVATEPLAPGERERTMGGGLCASDTHPLLRYFRQDEHGRLLLGGPGPWGGLRRPGQARPLLRMLGQLFPDLAGARITHAWSGRVALTADHLPHLHELAPGVHAALGCNGRGVALAVALGPVLARLALRSPEPPPLPLVAMRRAPPGLRLRPALAALATALRLGGLIGPRPARSPGTAWERKTP